LAVLAAPFRQGYLQSPTAAKRSAACIGRGGRRAPSALFQLGIALGVGIVFGPVEKIKPNRSHVESAEPAACFLPSRTSLRPSLQFVFSSGDGRVYFRSPAPFFLKCFRYPSYACFSSVASAR
jgi:hypothetical protein